MDALGSDWADLSLRWTHSHFVGFVTRRLNCEDFTPFSSDLKGLYGKTGISKHSLNNLYPFSKIYDSNSLMRLWYLSHRRMCSIRAVSPESSLFAHLKYGSRRRVWPKIRRVAPVDRCACLKIEFTEGDMCHNLMSQLNNNRKKGTRDTGDRGWLKRSVSGHALMISWIKITCGPSAIVSQNDNISCNTSCNTIIICHILHQYCLHDECS